MSITCTRCEGTGFLNADQIPNILRDAEAKIIRLWAATAADHDVCVCDCCGDGEHWHGVPGEHYNDADPPGDEGPYRFNGGLCECH